MSEHLRSAETISDYLNQRLSEEDLDAFEALMLDDPIFFEEVQLEQALREGLKATEPKLSTDSPSNRSMIARLTDYLQTPAWSFASTAGFVVCLIALYTTNTGTGMDEDLSEEAAVIGGIVYVENFRSTVLPTYRLTANTSLLLSIDASEFSGAPVNVSVSSSAGTNLLALQTEPNAEGEVNVVLMPLDVGTYELTLSSDVASRSYKLEAAI